MVEDAANTESYNLESYNKLHACLLWLLYLVCLFFNFHLVIGVSAFDLLLLVIRIFEIITYYNIGIFFSYLEKKTTLFIKIKRVID